MPTGAVVHSIPAIYKGSIIFIKSENKVFRVKRLNAKSLAVTDVDGKEYTLKLPSEYAWNNAFTEATPAQADDFRSREFTTQTDPARIMRVGNVVRWPKATHPLAKDKLLVVTKVNVDGDANLSPLGGTLTGEFFRSVPAIHLEKVDLVEGWGLPAANV